MIIRVLLQLTPASGRIKFETLIGLCTNPRSKKFSANLQDTPNPPQTWTSSIKPSVICISDRTSTQALERFLAWDTPGPPERKLRVAAACKWKFSVRPTGVPKSGQLRGAVDTPNPPQTWTSSIKPSVICISDRTSTQALERFLAWDTPGPPERKLRVAAACKWKFSVRPTGVPKSGQLRGAADGRFGRLIWVLS
jgi:hypothetical protein